MIDLAAATAVEEEGAVGDAEDEDVALVDKAVLEEEEKLREQRKKAEEANKTEVSATGG